jgi:hypothetical protein
MICAMLIGSELDTRAMKLAPEARPDHQRLEGIDAGAFGGELAAFPVRRRGRRGLALGHAIDLVVHHDVGQVDVAPAGMQEVVAADREAVAVAAGDQHREVGTRQLQAGGHRQGAAMHAVEAIHAGVGGNPRGAADAGDDRDFFRRQGQFGQGAGDRIQYGVIAATGTPDRLQVGLVVLGFVGLLLRTAFHQALPALSWFS